MSRLSSTLLFVVVLVGMCALLSALIFLVPKQGGVAAEAAAEATETPTQITTTAGTPAHDFTEGFSDWHPDLPSCASSQGQSDIVRTINNGPVARTMGFAAVNVIDIKTISASADKVECRATVIFNSDDKRVVKYSFSSPSPDGEYDIHAKWMGR